MPIQVSCPKCRKALAVADDMAGRGVRCPQCETAFHAPGSTVGDLAAAPAPPPGSPASIGPYPVRRKLGEGAFGVVYLCHDDDLDRDVAVKVLRAAALGSEKHSQRFLREAKVVAKMLHGNIVPVYQLGRHEGGYFIASAFIPGRPLADAVPEEGMDPVRAVRLTVQLVEALDYAHERGVMHRDVKPSNAMLVEKDGQDTLYLMDFGLAGLLDSGDARMTKDNTVMGTPAYMPPEQARGAVKEVGPASDQYSAGVVLYELLTGRLPFEAGSIHALIYAVINTPPSPPSSCRAGLDPNLEAICLRALAKKPEERFGSCREFAEALRNWLEQRRTAPQLPEKASGVLQPRKKLSGPETVSALRKRATLPASVSARRIDSDRTTVPPPMRAPSPPKARRSIWLVVVICVCVVGLPILLATGYFAWQAAAPSATKQAPEPKKPGGGVRDEINNQP